MKDESGALLPVLEKLFDGPADSKLTLSEFLSGLEGRSYAFAIAALDLPNVIPTGIPWLSTVTGVPMLILLGQFLLGRPVPSLPDFIGRRGLARGKLQSFLTRARPHILRIQRATHPRRRWWVSGTARTALFVTGALQVLLLALPVPFDNLLPAWAILFFCLALIESDGVMAILGWISTFLTVLWTIFLVFAGFAVFSRLFTLLGF